MSLGHNSVEGKALEGFIARVENVESEIKDLQGDRKEIYVEAQTAGYDKKVMQRIIRERKMERADLDEFDALVATYWTALGR